MRRILKRSITPRLQPPITMLAHPRFNSTETILDESDAAAAAATPSSSSHDGGADSSTFANIPGLVGMGVCLLSFSIVGITVNERRASKQRLLNDYAEEIIVSVTDYDDDDAVDGATRSNKRAEEFRGSLVHLFGDVSVTPPYPRDTALGVEVREGKLRLHRHVEMYQWQENKEENKKTKEVTYSYSQRWASHHLSTHDGRNPPFPHFPQTREAGALHISITDTLKFLLSCNFVERLDDWTETSVVVTNAAAAERYNLQLSEDGITFWTRGSSPASPQIGDLRVTFECIEPGVHTAIGKYDRRRGRGKMDAELQPFTAALSKKLAAEAEIAIPDEAHEIAKKGGLSNLTIPEWVVEAAESMILSTLPLEYAFVRRGEFSKAEALELNREKCEEDTTEMFMGLTISSVLGCLLLSSPIGLVSSSAQVATALTSGIGIAWTTRKNAQEQLQSAIKLQRPVKSSDGRSDVTF